MIHVESGTSVARAEQVRSPAGHRPTNRRGFLPPFLPVPPLGGGAKLCEAAGVRARPGAGYVKRRQWLLPWSRGELVQRTAGAQHSADEYCHAPTPVLACSRGKPSTCQNGTTESSLITCVVRASRQVRPAQVSAPCNTKWGQGVVYFTAETGRCSHPSGRPSRDSREARLLSVTPSRRTGLNPDDEWRIHGKKKFRVAPLTHSSK